MDNSTTFPFFKLKDKDKRTKKFSNIEELLKKIEERHNE